MKADCERFRRQLDLLAEPSGSGLVKRSLAPLVLVYGLGAQAEAPVFWRVYEEALSDLPRLALERAVLEWQRVGKFFPKPAEIRELAEPTATAFRMAAHRAKKASEWQAPKPRNDASRPTPEEIKAVMADFKAKMVALEPPQTKVKRRASPQARIDGAGMSPEARALLERQGTIKPRQEEQDRAA